MKTSLTKLKSSFLLLSLLTQPLWAKPVAQVTELTGQVFAVSPTGKTIAIKVNDHLEDKTEVMVEEGGTLTLNDYYDSTYHMIGGSHLKIFDKSVQLKRGKTWVQSQAARFPLSLITANGVVDFWKSEFIVTFDQGSSRSQVLVVNGDVEVSNILNRDVKQTVSGGSFTLIDPEVESGVPRIPTKVGFNSLNAALGEFKSLPKNIKVPTAARNIASVVVEEKAAAPVPEMVPTTPVTAEASAPVTAPKKGEIIFISSNRLPASVQGGAYNYFEKKLGKKKKHKNADSSASIVPVKFYGIANAPKMTTIEADLKPLKATHSTINAKESRVPASIAPQKIQEMGTAPAKVNLDQEFKDSLDTHMKDQPKNSSELESLIKDLQSY